MKKNFSYILAIFFSSFLFAAETFTFTPIINEVYTAREVALAGNYCADYSTFFSILANPANSALTGDKKLFPYISADMTGSLSKAYDLIRYSTSDDTETLASFLSTMEDIPISINMSGPICFGSVKNNFAISFFNFAYTSGTLSVDDDTTVYAGEQYLLNMTYAYPIKFGKCALAVGLGLFGFVDVQGIYTGSLVDALTYLKDKSYTFFPLYTTLGFGLNAGLSFVVTDIFTLGIAWNDFFGGALTQKFDSLTAFRSFQFTTYTPLGTMPLGDNLSVGLGLNLPLEECTKHFLTQTHLYVQYDNVETFFQLKSLGISFYPALLYEMLKFCFEVEMFHTITLRYGMCNTYMSAGLGLKAGMVHLDASLYSTKIGFTKNDSGNIGVSLSFGVYQ